MAPYQPPVAHYSELDVSGVDPEDIYSFIGKKGKRFYWLTRFLNLQYLWYNEPKKAIEIWGPYYTHENRQSALVIEAELEHFLTNRHTEGDDEEDAWCRIDRVPDEATADGVA